MIIVAEGADCAGKTTLLNDLEHEIQTEFPDSNVVRLHRGPMTGTIEEEYVDPLDMILETYDLFNPDGSPRNIILIDRWHMGELVYGPLLRKESKITDVEAYGIDILLDTMGALKLFVHADEQTIQDRVTADGDDLVNPHQAVLAQQMYEDLLYDRPDWVKVDTTDHAPPYQMLLGAAFRKSMTASIMRTISPGSSGNVSGRYWFAVTEEVSTINILKTAVSHRIPSDQIFLVTPDDLHNMLGFDTAGRAITISSVDQKLDTHIKLADHSVKNIGKVFTR